MHETPEDLTALRALLESSMAGAGPFLRSSFRMPGNSLNAHQLASYLQGALTIALATVTAQGAPRVAPIAALFYRGQFHIPTVVEAARYQMIQNNPAVSLSLFEGNDLAIIVHGTAAAILPGDPDFQALLDLQVASGGQSPLEWGKGLFLRIVAERFFTYARHPARFPSGQSEKS